MTTLLALTPIVSVGGSAILGSAISVGSPGGLIGLLVWVAIACVVIWGIIALVRWSGVSIPQPVWIILTCFVCIFLILLIAKAFGLVM